MDRADTRDDAALHTPGRTFMLFLMCAGVASVLWLFTTLSGTFEDTVSVSLTYDLPPDQTTTKQLPEEAALLVQTTGWQLIREEFNERSLSINISDIDANDELITNAHIHLFIADMPSDIHVLHVYPDTISLHMEARISKTVPVELFATLSGPGVLLDSLRLVPDSVLVTGPESLVRNITKWNTDPVITFIDSAMTGIAALAQPAHEEIALSAVACQYFVKLDTPMKVSFPGNAYCAMTGTPVSVILYAEVPISHAHAYAFEDFLTDCNHQQGDHHFVCTGMPRHAYNTIVIETLNTPEW